MHERTQGRARGAVAGRGSGEAVFEAGRTETRGGEGRSRERERGGRARAHIGFVGTWQRCAGSDSGRRTRRSGVAQGMQVGGEGLRRRRSGPAS